MLVPNFNSNILSIGFINIKWYSLAYIFGILIAWFLIKYYNKKYILSLYSDESAFCDDFFFYLILGIVLGGRIGYVLFYDPIYFINNLSEIFAIWKGGMSFHGGFAGVVISSLFLCKKHNINKLLLLDLGATVVPVGLFFGRIANFINLELYGRPTKMPWSMIFPGSDGVARHPSQLYEALLEGIILFVILNILVKIKKFKIIGLQSSVFLMLYSIFRIFIEFFREPDIQLGFFFKYITMGQLLSLPMFALGLYLFVKKVYKNI